MMNIVGGNVVPDRGRMLFRGQEYRPAGPKAAVRAGVGFVHQELNLFLNLTVAENLMLTGFPRVGRWPLINRRELNRRAAELLGEVGLAISPETIAGELAAGERKC